MNNVEQIEAKMAQNIAEGREESAGLTSAEIGAYNRSIMFGSCNDWDDKEWSRIVD